MSYVVDASVCVKWYVPEILEQHAAKLLSGQHELHAPELIYPELGNIVWKKVRRHELSEAEGKRINRAFSRHGLFAHPHQNLIQSAFAGAVLTGQTVYDWTYLALAVSLSCTFVTADRKFYLALTRTQVGKYLTWLGDI